MTYDDLVHFSSPKMNWVVKLNPTFVILSWWINNKSFHYRFSKSIDHAIYKLHLLDAIVWNIEDHIKQVAFFNSFVIPFPNNSQKIFQISSKVLKASVSEFTNMQYLVPLNCSVLLHCQKVPPYHPPTTHLYLQNLEQQHWNFCSCHSQDKSV
jgi:hypothetical protein